MEGRKEKRSIYIVKCATVVEEQSTVGRSITERICGRSRRENAGISSESEVRIFTVENLRIPGEGSSAQGKSGPKWRPKGVHDGKQLKITALPKPKKLKLTQERKVSKEEERLAPKGILKKE